ncbi:RidA family protein [Natronobacterium gregoryi]|uniref:Endoribonuclease L-PSP n=2 Tax=Natronobacterium gregoryi TaxID=44930 RepID=L0AEA2_NATGS|nr:RidA family protein [Natronobacterium gregoryi]AFZ71477.1 putative translation initiation inhibitor, yjgF family [Natronobacterium gregoryi SP2]ELY66779.1 endoribonuclease L-PSP [Natronobacterium gregoryi SP2]PLK19931.1 RidA family protein [Natronobacterium gregoryi SP2]SFJ36590.1 Enamine deaminase RidA, house cleaning of reactive enamine intermediates, YjgF/YER057c/UK114 family [Natronobacterium gregoryi]
MDRSRQHVSSETEWESRVGYSRAVRAGPHVHVSGTTATDEDGNVVGRDDPAEQTRYVLEIIQNALEEADTTLEDVVRTRIYVVDIDDWDAIGRAHAEVFGEIGPATSMVEVNRLISPELLVEIEATAYVGSE